MVSIKLLRYRCDIWRHNTFALRWTQSDTLLVSRHLVKVAGRTRQATGQATPVSVWTPWLTRTSCVRVANAERNTEAVVGQKCPSKQNGASSVPRCDIRHNCAVALWLKMTLTGRKLLPEPKSGVYAPQNSLGNMDAGRLSPFKGCSNHLE